MKNKTEGCYTPGDIILHRAMPNASAEEREAARERLYAFAAVVLRIATRLQREARDKIRAERDAAVE